MREHDQHIVSLEDGAESSDQHIQQLEVRCAALAKSTDKLLAKTSDFERRSQRKNIQIVGLLESIEGLRATELFAELLVELLGSGTLSSPPELDWAHKGSQ